jgi:hypothetical protein
MIYSATAHPTSSINHLDVCAPFLNLLPTSKDYNVFFFSYFFLGVTKQPNNLIFNKQPYQNSKKHEEKLLPHGKATIKKKIHIES